MIVTLYIIVHTYYNTAPIDLFLITTFYIIKKIKGKHGQKPIVVMGL